MADPLRARAASTAHDSKPSSIRQETAMQRKTFLGVLLAAAGLGIAAPSFAQPRDRGHEDRANERHQDDRHDRPERRPDRGRGEWEREMHAPTPADGARGPEWHRGGHLPPAYRDRAYVVNDWRLHRLAPPPRGYEWVQVGADYVLVAVRTGVIAQIVVID
jgi:Ni/Co efflux regulator RcnB